MSSYLIYFLLVFTFDIAVYSSDAQWSIHIWLCFRNAGNQTPLDLAYQDENSDVSIVLYLIGQGANAALKPVFKGKPEMHRGFNFLDWAIERKHRLLTIVVCW